MLEGFPLPDLDFDMPEDDVSYFRIEESSHKLNDEDYNELCENNGLVIENTEPIRSSNNSSIYAAKSPVDGKTYAVKIADRKQRILDEFERQKQIKESPYLVKSVSFMESPTKAMIQMEYCKNGDIRNLYLAEEAIWKLIHDIGNALATIHNDGWMHLDVSPGNILIGKRCFKLSDFGTLTPIGQFEEGLEGAGPYVSPEIFTFPDSIVGTATDIFSFGVVLLEAATGRQAPRGGSELYTKIRTGEVFIGDEHYPCEFSEGLINLIRSMMNPDPDQRPTANQLIELDSVSVYD